jgi:hypothetical protein
MHPQTRAEATAHADTSLHAGDGAEGGRKILEAAAPAAGDEYPLWRVVS